MNKDILHMVKIVSGANCVVGIILSICVQLIMKNYGLYVLLGMFMAIVNFNINSLVGELVFSKFKNSSASLYILNFILRIVLAAGIGYIVFKHNNYGVIAYLFGYTSHLVGVYIYSVIKNK